MENLYHISYIIMRLRPGAHQSNMIRDMTSDMTCDTSTLIEMIVQLRDFSLRDNFVLNTKFIILQDEFRRRRHIMCSKLVKYFKHKYKHKKSAKLLGSSVLA